jgi:hypothetical protein
MAFEKAWEVVPPQDFTADGSTFGQVTIANTAGFKVKQSAYLIADGLPALPVQIKRVLSPTTMVVGTINNSQIATFKPLNISAYTVAKNAAIGAQEQPKNEPTVDDIFKAVYESDPTVALRVIFTDQYGNLYSEENPLPATFSGSISIGAVEVKGSTGNIIEPNADGSLNVHIVDGPTTTQTVKSKYNEVFSVASGVQTTIVTYTVPSLKTAILERINTSGQNVGRYDVLINGVPFDTQITYFGGSFNALFEYTTGSAAGYTLNAGDIVTVTILHNSQFVGNFTSRIQVLEIS